MTNSPQSAVTQSTPIFWAQVGGLALVQGSITLCNLSLTMGLVFLALASTALPAGTLTTCLGNRRAIISGLAPLTLLAARMLAVHTAS